MKTINIKIILIFLLLACNNRSENEIIERKVYQNGKTAFEKVKLKDGRIHVKDYYSTGQLSEEYYLIDDSLKDGKSISYYQNGNILIEEFWQDGYRIGMYKSYYETGLPELFIEFVKTSDSIPPKNNQLIKFDENGDTLKDQSIYYDIYSIKDSVGLEEQYFFMIKLVGAVFDNTIIHLGNYDSLFSKLPFEDNIYKFNDKYMIELSKKAENLGINNIRGKIVNFELLPDGQIGRKIEILFKDSFYVK